MKMRELSVGVQKQAIANASGLNYHPWQINNQILHRATAVGDNHWKSCEENNSQNNSQWHRQLPQGRGESIPNLLFEEGFENRNKEAIPQVANLSSAV